MIVVSLVEAMHQASLVPRDYLLAPLQARRSWERVWDQAQSTAVLLTSARIASDSD